MDTPKPPVSAMYPNGLPVARWHGSVQPPIVAPHPNEYWGMKTALPGLPSVSQLFHKPRTPGNGDGRL